MIITASEMNLSSRYFYQEQRLETEHLELWAPAGDNSSLSKSDQPRLGFDKIEISAKALAAQQLKSTEEDSLFPLSAQDKLKISLIQMFMERLTGKSFKFVLPQEFNLKQNAGPVQKTVTPIPPGWGISYQAQSYYHEAEQSSFKAQGIVKTADGKTIDISLQLNMSREFTQKSEISFKAGAQAIDPLVINYQGTAASLTQRTFAFDLNSDGIQEQIAFLKPGSGFLALDKNGDGIINDGSELFGPNSGNGFDELAQYDEDGNGWIDAGDSIYTQLKIWSKDENGNDVLIALQDAGVGAIMLAHINTPFSLNDSNNETLGLIRHSGIFLREDGSSGTVQQLDLVV